MDVLKDILDNLSDSVIIVDTCGQIVLFNNEALRIQRSISEKKIEIGAQFSDLVSEERKQTVTDVLRTLKRRKQKLYIHASQQGNYISAARDLISIPSGGKEIVTKEEPKKK